jgi:hypothetical protein
MVRIAENQEQVKSLAEVVDFHYKYSPALVLGKVSRRACFAPISLFQCFAFGRCRCDPELDYSLCLNALKP